MIFFVSKLSVGEAGTVINAILAFVSFTMSASLVVLLIFCMPKTTTAPIWSSLARTIHSSIWPTLLRTESSSSATTTPTLTFLSYLTLFTTLLIPITSVTLPAGLHDGPLLQGSAETLPTNYTTDTSPLALSTTPDRSTFQYGRVCGFFNLIPCPGKSDNSTSYAPSTIDIFNSTPYSPFSMQFRRFGNSPSYRPNISLPIWGTAQTLLLQEGLFAIDGLIVDMTIDNFGVGFWNQSLPDARRGGSWSQDVLWMEPVTSCVNTNLTFDYVQPVGATTAVYSFNLTDRGGFYNLSVAEPTPGRQGQDLDLYQLAYNGAAWSDDFNMAALNITRETSFNGNTFLRTTEVGNSTFTPINIGATTALPQFAFMNSSIDSATANLQLTAQSHCQGFDINTSANISTVQVACGVFLGPPLRTDGGDERMPNEGSQWQQQIHVCASTTRASIQTITFSTNSTNDLQNVRLSRQPSTQSVLWAVENSNMTIADVNLLWGTIDDKFEGDPSVSTLRSGALYLPAGITDELDSAGGDDTQPSAAYHVAWAVIYDSQMANSVGSFFDYSGATDYGIKTKLQSFVKDDPIRGPSRIRNLVWTDIMANNLIGDHQSPSLLTYPYYPSITYDAKFAIPGLILVAIWIPVFFMSVFLLASRKISFTYMKQYLNHTSVGRVVVGATLLQPHGTEPNAGPASGSGPAAVGGSEGLQHDKLDAIDNVLVTLKLGSKGQGRGAEHQRLISRPE